VRASKRFSPGQRLQKFSIVTKMPFNISLIFTAKTEIILKKRILEEKD
jgi:hypothetical protein